MTLLAAGCVLTPAPDQVPTAPAQLVVRSVSVVDPDRGTASAPQDIFIDAGRIAAIAPAGALSLPQGTRQLDGTGRFLIPGLIDVHAHVGEGGVAPQNDSTRERALTQFLRYGVTSIFVPGATGASDADFPRLRERCRSHAIACPDLFGTGSLITAPGSHPVSTIFRMPPDVPPQVTEARGVTMLQPAADIDALITAKASAGVDAIKIIVEDGPLPGTRSRGCPTARSARSSVPLGPVRCRCSPTPAPRGLRVWWWMRGSTGSCIPQPTRCQMT